MDVSSPESGSDNGFADNEEPSRDLGFDVQKQTKSKEKKKTRYNFRKPSESCNGRISFIQKVTLPKVEFETCHKMRSSYPPTAPCQVLNLRQYSTRASIRRGSTGNILEKKKYAFSSITPPRQSPTKTPLPSISSFAPTVERSFADKINTKNTKTAASFRLRELSEVSARSINTRYYDQYDIDIIPNKISPIKNKQVIPVSNKDKTDLEFIEFARDFALACSRKPMFSLLSEGQYACYRKKTVTPGSLLSDNQYAPLVQSLTPTSYYRTQKTPECAPQPEGHVVGDILAFITNTMRYKTKNLNFDFSKILLKMVTDRMLNRFIKVKGYAQCSVLFFYTHKAQPCIFWHLT